MSKLGHILLIEPDPIHARHIIGQLNNIGCPPAELSHHSTTAAALDFLAVRTPNVILLDEQLSDHELVINWARKNLIPLVFLFEENGHSLEAERQNKTLNKVANKRVTGHQLQQILNEAIGERKLYQWLADSEQRYQSIFNEIPTAIRVFNQHKQLIDANQAACDLFGYSREEQINTPTEQLIHPDTRDTFQQFFETLDREEPFHKRVLALHKDGRTLRVRVNGLRLSINGEYHYLSMMQDETDRFVTEEQNQQLISAVQNTDSMVMITDTQALITYVNPSVMRQTGYSEAELIGQPASIFQSGRTSAHVYEDMWDTIRRGHQWIGEFYNRRKSGDYYWVGTTINPVQDSNGNITHFVAIQQDITAQKSLQAELQASNEQLTLLNKIISLAHSSLNIQKILEITCRELAHHFNVPQSSAGLINEEHTVLEIVAEYIVPGRPPSLGMKFPVRGNKTLQRLANTLTSFAIHNVKESEELNFGRENILIRETESLLLVPIVVNNELVGSIGVDSLNPRIFTPSEITFAQLIGQTLSGSIYNSWLHRQVLQHNEQLEELIQERTGQLQQTMDQTLAILNNNSDTIVLTSLDGRIIQTNEAFQTLFDPVFENVIGRSIYQFLIEDSANQIKQFIEGSQKILTRHFDLTSIGRSGSFLPVHVAVTVVRTLNLNGVVCSFRDGSEKKAAEEALRQALKKEKEVNEMKSRFISIASHEFRNPLATIQMSVSMLETVGEKLSSAQKNQKFQIINDQIRRLTKLMEEIVLASRSEAGQLSFMPVSIAIEEMVKHTVYNFQETTGLDHRLRLESSVADLLIEADELLLSQILNNLISNAIKYNSPDGLVTVKLSHLGDHLRLEVIDEGIGIPEEDQPGLFEAFYRAGNVGQIQGTGLGLMVTRSAVMQHGGSISFTSREGQGSSFVVLMPISQS